MKRVIDKCSRDEWREMRCRGGDLGDGVGQLIIVVEMSGEMQMRGDDEGDEVDDKSSK